MGVIGEEVAKEELKKIEEYYDIALESDQEKVLLRAIKSGRLDFDQSEEIFTVHLVKPVKLANGEEIKSISIQDFEIEAYKEAFKPGRGETEATIHLISSITGQPVGVINRFKVRDVTLIGVLLAFFA